MKSAAFGGAVIQWDDEGLTCTFIPGAGMVEARPHLEGEVHSREQAQIYRERAEAHGYEDVHTFSRDHEILHSLLAHWSGPKPSPALKWVALGCGPIGAQERAVHAAEESVVLALQAYFKRVGMSVPGLAQRADYETRTDRKA